MQEDSTFRKISFSLVLITVMVAFAPARSFKDTQSRFPRVRAAYRAKGAWLSAKLAEKNLKPGEIHIFLRAFKREKVLELWVRKGNQGKFSHLLDYSFCAFSGILGPKRRQGDLQIPEGYYYIDRFNAWSHFHLSLGINYPNTLDRKRATGPDPGGDIFIHGNCVTIGCIPITDDKIKELYLFAVEAKNNGQTRIPVHIFPARLSSENMRKLAAEYDFDPNLIAFWKNLKKGYDLFEKTKTLPKVTVTPTGTYKYQSPGGDGG